MNGKREPQSLCNCDSSHSCGYNDRNNYNHSCGCKDCKQCSDLSPSQGISTQTARGSGYQAQLVISSGKTTILDGNTVIFNRILNSSNQNMVYNKKNGEFTINRASNYFVNWSVTFDGTNKNSYVAFALELNGKKYEVSTTPLVIGSVIGSSLITITQIPARLRLKNVTGDIVSFTSINPVANIVITDLN